MQELINRLLSADRCIVISHVHPDGDAIGSLTALTLGLEQLGKQVVPVLADPVPSAFQFAVGLLEITNELPPLTVEEPYFCVTVDLPDTRRTGFSDAISEYGEANMLGFIDHHPLGDLQKKTTAYYHTLQTSSCAELIYHLLLALGVRITPPIATALLTGMYTDSGGFQYDNTSTETMELGAELMRRGARLRTIVDHTSRQKSNSSLRLLGVAMERLTVTNNGTCAVSVITYNDIQKAGGNTEDASGIINQLNVLPGTRLCMLLTEAEPGIIRGSLRSTDHPDMRVLNVTTLAKLFGGGGHARASGFLVDGHLELSENQWKVT